MTNRLAVWLLVVLLAVVFWIVVPLALYLAFGLWPVIVFLILNLLAMGGAVIFFGRS